MSPDPETPCCEWCGDSLGNEPFPPERYVILCEGRPVYTTDRAEEVVTYLWGRVLRRHPHAPWRYTVLDYEVPYVVETGDLCAWLARLPVEDPLPRPALPLQPPENTNA